MTELMLNKDNKWLKKRKRLLIGVLTIVLIIFMIFIVDFQKFIQKVIIIGFWGTIVFAAIYTLAFILRSYKLKLIFKGLEQPIKYSTAYFSIGGCFLINDITPGKLGDFAKMALIKDQENIPLSDSVCGIAIERVLDLILLFFITMFAFIYLFIFNIRESESTTILGQNLQFYYALGAIFIIGIVIGLILLIYKTDTILKVIGKISAKLENLLTKFIMNFKNGIIKFKKHKRELVLVILIGIPTWIIDAIIIVLFFYILGYELNIILLLLAIIISYFCKIFPITPGGWGISENIGALFIYLFYPEIPFIEILAVFIIDHLFRSAYLAFYGGFSTFHYNIKLKEANQLLS